MAFWSIMCWPRFFKYFSRNLFTIGFSLVKVYGKEKLFFGKVFLKRKTPNENTNEEMLRKSTD